MDDQACMLLLICPTVERAQHVMAFGAAVRYPQLVMHWVAHVELAGAYVAANRCDIVLIDAALLVGQQAFVEMLYPQMAILALIEQEDSPHITEINAFGVQDYIVADQLSAAVLGQAIRFARERQRLLQSQRFLIEAGALLSSSLDYSTTLRQVGELSVPALADWCLIDLVGPDGQIERVQISTADPAQALRLGAFQRHFPAAADSHITLFDVLHTGRSVVLPQISAEQLAILAPDPEQVHMLTELGLHSCMIAPLIARGHVLGTVSLAMASSARRFRPNDLPLIDKLAYRIAMAIDNAQLYRAAQAELAERQRAEGRFAQVFRASPLGILVTRQRDGQIVDVNDSYLQLVEYRRDELLGQSIRALGLLDPETVRGFLAQLTERGSLRDVELTLRAKSGQLRHVLAAVELLELGGDACILTLVYDISARKQAEQALERYAERLGYLRSIDQSILVSSSPQAIAEITVLHIGKLIECTRVAIVLIDQATQDMRLIALQISGQIQAFPPHILPLNLLGRAALECLEHGQPYEVPDLHALPDVPANLRTAQVEGVRAYLYMPIMVEAQLIGTLNIGVGMAGLFSEEQREIASDLANQLSIALTQARLREQVQQYALDLEQRVAERTVQLEAINKELEAFSYSVSHDLRAPLRAIDGFSRILLEDYHAALPEEAQYYLQLVRSNTQQMGRLVDDLLAFARLSRQSLHKVTIVMTELVQRCLVDLASERADRAIELVVEDLPVAEADPALLKQVWLNLIENALKYTRRCEQAQIRIGSYVDGTEIVYFIKDNGVGFDMRYIDKLFGVFQRMHRAEDYEGTGVGLAIVQRIVNRHGGRVWATAEVNRGAEFSFTLRGRYEH